MNRSQTVDCFASFQNKFSNSLSKRHSEAPIINQKFSEIDYVVKSYSLNVKPKLDALEKKADLLDGEAFSDLVERSADLTGIVANLDVLVEIKDFLLAVKNKQTAKMTRIFELFLVFRYNQANLDSFCSQLVRNLVQNTDNTDISAITNKDSTLNIIRAQKSLLSIEIEPFVSSETQVCEGEDCFENWPSLEIAKQLTLVSFHLYRKIRLSEFFNAQWTKAERGSKAKNLVRMIARFNAVCSLTKKFILASDKEEERAKMISKFLEIAECLCKIHNFNDGYAVFMGLNSFASKNLKRSWEEIDEKHREIYYFLVDFFSLTENYKNLREKQADLVGKETCLPYIGLFMKDISFDSEGKEVLSKGMVDEKRLNSLNRVYEHISLSQLGQFAIKPVFSLAYLADLKAKADEVFDLISVKLEPVLLLNRPIKKEVNNAKIGSLFVEVIESKF